VAGPVRPGHHGYLIFEDPGRPGNRQLADGPTLGRLLTATGVPVLLLNACRSAYTEAPSRPGQPGSAPADPAAPADGHAALADGHAAPAGGEVDAELADVHARIRAYGSLAAEVADAGVPGVVAMRYNVYVVTAAQYAADLYAHLLAGAPLGHAATAARRALADNPTRQIGAVPVALQDWAVPVVYEATPLTLLQRGQREAPLIQLTLTEADGADADAADALPRPPDAGFFGRDETLLALDRAFDTQQIVLVHGFAGAGKTTTVAEFARWYRDTGGLHHPAIGSGPVLWSSFEHHLPLNRLLDTVGDCFSEVLEASKIHWHALTSLAQRRNLVLQLLAQVPVLWVWDNVEPVTGFPPGTPSAWTAAEQDEIADFLRDLAQKTRCKVLLTSRRDEQAWLANLPTRAPLPPMPMRERLQLAYAIAVRNGHTDPGTDWRPLLRYTAGNPLTITVLVGQAVRDKLTTTEKIKAFVARLRAGEQELEGADDAALGRTRSLAASLSYGFTHACTDAERDQLAVLHLFRDTVDADALRLMGDPGIIGDDAVPELADLTRETSVGLLSRAAEIGLLTSLGGGYYSIHPALPWYFTALFGTAYGQPDAPEARRATRAYTHAIAVLSGFYGQQSSSGTGNPVPALRVEEANLLHALGLARQAQGWEDAMSCLDGLGLLYQRTGRDREWARLVTDITPDFIDPATGNPLPGRENGWTMITEYRVGLATDARDWPTATRLQQARVARARHDAAAALAAPGDQLTPEQRHQIRTLAVSIEGLGRLLRYQKEPGCIAHYEESMGLYQRIHDTHAECNLADSIGNAYRSVPGLRDLDRAEQWYRRSLDLEPEDNIHGRAESLASLATVAHERYSEAQDANEPESVLRAHLSAAMDGYQQALDLVPDDDSAYLSRIYHRIGSLFAQAGDVRMALLHFQKSLAHEEARGNTYGAGQTRHNIAAILAADGRPDDALLYARAALHDFEQVGPGAGQDVAATRDLIAQIEQLTP
jgi:tetratricopeptide (TPR) repeat protein